MNILVNIAIVLNIGNIPIHEYRVLTPTVLIGFVDKIYSLFDRRMRM